MPHDDEIQTLECERCGKKKPLRAFHSFAGTPWKRCIECLSKEALPLPHACPLPWEVRDVIKATQIVGEIPCAGCPEEMECPHSLTGALKSAAILMVAQATITVFRRKCKRCGGTLNKWNVAGDKREWKCDQRGCGWSLVESKSFA